MPTIKPNRNFVTPTSEFYPIEVFLEDEFTPYSRKWRYLWWKEDSDVASQWVGNGGMTGLINVTIENHPIYDRFLGYTKRFKFNRPNSILQLLMEYVYPTVLQQVVYYNLPHNPSIAYEYDYFKHLAGLLDVHTHPRLKEFLTRLVSFIDSVYETWPANYFHLSQWNPDKDLSVFDGNVVYGDNMSISSPPISHPVWNPDYVDTFGSRLDAYPVLTAEDLDFENDIELPVFPNEDPRMEPEPEPVVVTPSQPKDDDKNRTITISFDDQQIVIPVEEPTVSEPVQPTIPPMPEPNRPVSDAMRQRLEEIWVLYKLQTASISEQTLLAYYGVIDYGAIYTGKSRR